jgi:2',3'-cyclic-nucleotide 2'-phosphodiesterase (5'-nucleotidase family)
LDNGSESVKQLMSQMNELAVSANVTVITPPSDSTEGSNSGNPVQDIDKRIRALKKKVGFIHLAFPANTNDHIVHVSHLTLY